MATINKTGIAAIHNTSRICFKFTRPININSSDVRPVNNAVEKILGIINIQIVATGIIIGENLLEIFNIVLFATELS
jgi:hypothetical protein